MEFDSPDVEKDFPGLYSSESVKKNNESDFSDESHEKSFKSELIGKRKDKKESKKDRGYAALEGESSPDEGDAKSPSKGKKSKSFKFPVKKSEKREKSRDKDAKDKEIDKEKKKERDKKEKIKQKDRKKGKQAEDVADGEEHAVFGVSLSLAVARLGCLDGVGIPLPVRHSIECVHNNGLSTEGLYKTEKLAGLKTKLQTLKKRYNARENVCNSDMDVPLATTLFITFLKELPEPVLTNELMARFEEAGAVQDVAQREEELNNLVKQLPECNSTLLAWIIVHFDHVTLHEKHNKINAQSIAMTFSPVLQMSHRLLTALLCHCKALFPETDIVRYVPPLAPGSQFPEHPAELSVELKKQESLLTQIHHEMNEGFVNKNREELLWEVQRIVTQLKRKLRSLRKTQEISQMQKSIDEEQAASEEIWKMRDEKIKEIVATHSDVSIKDTEVEHVETAEMQSSKSISPVEDVACKVESKLNKEDVKGDIPPITPSDTNVERTHEVKVASVEPEPQPIPTPTAEEPDQETPIASPNELTCENPLYGDTISPPWEDEAKLQLEHVELLKFQSKLQERLNHERREADKLRGLIDSYRGIVDSASEDSSANSSPTCRSPETEARLEQLAEENQQLLQKRDELVRRIMEEKQACIKLNVSMNYLKLEQRYRAT